MPKKSIIQHLFDFVAPYDCLVCGREGKILCTGCSRDVVEPVPSRCFRCFKASKDFSTCKPCKKQSPLERVWAVTCYESYAKELVRHMKFHANRTAATTIGEILDNELPFFPPNTVVSYVPTAPVRVRERGFDHARIIAHAFARYRGLACKTLLVRTGTSSQVGAHRTDRIKQAQHAYEPSGVRISASTVLLIDDVITTGSTLSSAAKTLRKAGFKQISGAVFSQTL